MKRNGFTLVELMVVIAIIGISVAIIIPAVQKYRADTKSPNVELAEKPTETPADSNFIVKKESHGDYTFIIVKEPWNEYVIMCSSNWVVKLR